MTARLVIFVSGSGTNLQAIFDAIAQGDLDAEVRLVVSNRKAAYGLVRAEQAGVPTLYFPLKRFVDAGRSRQEYDQALAELIAEAQPDLIVLAGWMHIFDAVFLEQFPDCVINLHPALPGQFPGVDAIRRTYEAYRQGIVSGGGCMVHYVIPEIDAGRVIAEAVVPCNPEDSLEMFEARLHNAEHRLLIEALQSVLGDPNH